MWFLELIITIHMFQVRIMRKRLVRKTFDMIQDIADKDSKEVRVNFLLFPSCCFIGLFLKLDVLCAGLQEILGELWQIYETWLH